MSPAHPRLQIFALALGLFAFGPAGCASSLDKGLRQVEQGDYRGAERQFKAALDDPQLEAQARAELAKIQLRRAKNAERSQAEALYLEALAYDPDLEEARLDLARMYMTDERFEEGIALLEAREGCSGCASLEAALLYERGKKHIAAGKGEMARADLERSLAYRDDPLVALAIVDVYAKAGHGDGLQAVEDLRRAAKMIEEGDRAAQVAFAETRERLATAAATKLEPDAVDQTLATPVPFTDMSEDYRFAFEVSRAEFQAGDFDRALDRAALILLEHYDELSEEDKITYNAALAYMYSMRAAHELAEGDAQEAKEDLATGLFASPGNKTMLLQQVLAEAIVDTREALDMLDDLDVAQARDNQIRAIVYAMQVHDALQDGRVSSARRALERAQELAPDIPETRVAMAELLMNTRVPDLKRDEFKAIRDKGLFRYPRGRVNSYGEALAELRWAKDHLAKLDDNNPFRGPGLVARIEDLENEITGFYPYRVEFHPESTGVVVVENVGDEPIDFSMAVNGQREKQTLAPKTPVEIVVQRPGFTEVQAGAVDKVMITEPYTRIFVELK